MANKKKIVILSLLTGLAGVLLFCILLHPIYNSKEDFYLLYQFSGGFNTHPQEAGYYNHLLHPFLGYIIKSLFSYCKTINWYSVFLLLAHFLSISISTYSFLQTKSTIKKSILYIILLLLFEGYFILILDFTGASLCLTISSLIFLLRSTTNNKLLLSNILIGIAILLLASLYRVHTTALMAFLSLPFFYFTLNTKGKIKISFAFAITAILVAGLNYLQRDYNEKQVPGWHTSEKYRQKIYQFYNNVNSTNRPNQNEKWHTEFSLINKGLFWDTTFLSTSRLDSLYDESRVKSVVRSPLPKGWAKWFFLNSRIFILFTLFSFFYFGLTSRLVKPAIVSLAILISLFLYLFFTKKTPNYIVVSSLYLINLAFLIDSTEPIKKSINSFIKSVGIIIFCCWTFWRLHTVSTLNKTYNTSFKSQYSQIAKHPDVLFISVGGFAIDDFYIFDTPTNFILPNYLDTEHFILNIYQPVFKKFGINKTEDILTSKKVLFWGEPSEGVRLYFEKKTGKSIEISPRLPEFKEGYVWRLIVKETDSTSNLSTHQPALLPHSPKPTY